MTGMSPSSQNCTEANVRRVPIEPVDGIEICMVKLGAIGKSDDDFQRGMNKDLAEYIPKMEKFVESGLIKPMEFDVIGDIGFKEVNKALDAFNNKKGGEKKIVVRLAEE